MKNKTFKNLIVLGAFAVFILGFNSALAYGGYGPDYNSSSNYYNFNSYSNRTLATQGYNTYSEQPYTYVQPRVNYIEQPTPVTEIRYIPQETIKYVEAAPKTTSTKTVASNTTKNTTTNTTNSTTDATGKYVNYDENKGNTMGASAYGANNGLTALSVKGSNSFMPSSIFQWFLFIILILAIIVVARMISKTFSKNSHAAPAH